MKTIIVLMDTGQCKFAVVSEDFPETNNAESYEARFDSVTGIHLAHDQQDDRWMIYALGNTKEEALENHSKFIHIDPP